MAGFSQGGGVGLTLANWMINGDPGYDIWGMDVARYGTWATLSYTNAKVQENYRRRFRIRFPNEELPAARPQQTTPLYDRMLAQAPSWATAGAWKHRSGSLRKAWKPGTSSPTTAPTILSTSAPSAGLCARAWA